MHRVTYLGLFHHNQPSFSHSLYQTMKGHGKSDITGKENSLQSKCRRATPFEFIETSSFLFTMPTRSYNRPGQKRRDTFPHRKTPIHSHYSKRKQQQKRTNPPIPPFPRATRGKLNSAAMKRRNDHRGNILTTGTRNPNGSSQDVAHDIEKRATWRREECRRCGS